MRELDKWTELCAQAAIETNPANFLVVEEQIIRLLKEKETRLDALPNLPGQPVIK